MERLSHIDVHKWSKKLSKKIKDSVVKTLNFKDLLTQVQFDEIVDIFSIEDSTKRDQILEKIDPVDLFAYLKSLSQLFLHISHAKLHNMICSKLSRKLDSKYASLAFESKKGNTKLVMRAKWDQGDSMPNVNADLRRICILFSR